MTRFNFTPQKNHYIAVNLDNGARRACGQEKAGLERAKKECKLNGYSYIEMIRPEHCEHKGYWTGATYSLDADGSPLDECIYTGVKANGWNCNDESKL